MAKETKETSIIANRKDMLGVLCLVSMVVGTASFWQENQGSAGFIWLLFVIWTLIPIGILTLFGMLMDKWFPFPAVHHATNVLIITVGLLGITGYLLTLLNGKSDPDTAGHMGVFLISPLQIFLTFFLFTVITIWGTAIRCKRRTSA